MLAGTARAFARQARAATPSLLRALLVACIAAAYSLALPAVADGLADFKDPFNGAPLKFERHPGEVATPAVGKFMQTGVNDYRGDAAAIAEGKELYTEYCAVCHGEDGKGKMGPTLVGPEVVYKQVLTDPGMFSVIYAGASGAMQSFFRRGMTQDQILRIVAYVRTLDK